MVRVTVPAGQATALFSVPVFDDNEVEATESFTVSLVDPATCVVSEPGVAEVMAKEDELDLTDEHWKVVNYLREYYLQFGVAPMIRKVTKETGFNLKKIYELFPSGPAKGACKVAGLPKPTGCV